MKISRFELIVTLLVSAICGSIWHQAIKDVANSSLSMLEGAGVVLLPPFVDLFIYIIAPCIIFGVVKWTAESIKLKRALKQHMREREERKA